MGQKSFIGLAAFLAVLIGGAVALYVYDSSRDDLIADGVTVARIHVGGLRTAEARRVVRERVATGVEQPIVVKFRSRRYSLSAHDARLRADVDGMVDEAVARSRDGDIFSRAARDLTGGRVDEDVPAKVGYSSAAVDRLVARVRTGSDQPARDARIGFDGNSPAKVTERDGIEINAASLRNSIRAGISNPNRNRVVRSTARITHPKVTTAQLADKYPKLIVINRAGFKLTYYENLKPKRSYKVAVGMPGLETPPGRFDVANKGVNVPWSVPNQPWAGDQAGKTIPGGAPDNPIKARWLGIADGVGIHGTDDIASLGTAASHGCIRMAIPEVIRLYKVIPTGTPVYIS